MWMYWGKGQDVVGEAKGLDIGSEKFVQRPGTVDIVVQPASPVGQQRFGSPSGRRWARKVD